MPSLGEAYIEVHADTGPFDRELAASIEKALIAAEATMRARGRDAGNAFGEGVESAIDDHVKRIGDNMSDGLVEAAENAGRNAAQSFSDGLNDGLNIDFNPDLAVNIPVDVDDDNLGDKERELVTWSQRVSRAMAGAFTATGGLFTTVTTALNQVSRISTILNPGVLTLLFGVISGAVFGLLSVLTPLVGLLSLAPAALLSMAASGLVLASAFEKVANSIGKIFGADSLEKALEVTERFEGGTRKFLEGLAYLSQAWRDMGVIVQDAFFRPFDDSLKQLGEALSSGPMLAAMRNLADSLGRFANSIIKTFASKPFVQMLKDVLNTTANIINAMAGPFSKFISGFAKLIDESLPYFELVMAKIGEKLAGVGDWFAKISENGSFQKFLDDALYSAGLLWDIFVSVIALITTIVDKLRETGDGENFLKTILLVIESIRKFLDSDEGSRFIETTVAAAEGVLLLAGATFIALARIWNAFIAFWQGVEWVFKKIADFFIWLAGGVAEGEQAVKMSAGAMVSALRNAWNAISTAVSTKVTEVVNTLRSLKSKISVAFESMPGMLYRAGANLIQGFINGIKDAVPGLASTLNWITGMIPDLKGPEETDRKLLVGAGYDVMQGFRRGLAMGAQGVIEDLRAFTGMVGMNANANSYVFGAGSIVQNFNGSQPTVSTANAMGTATGSAIADAVNSQNARASVRAM